MVILNGTVVHFRMLFIQQDDHFSSCPDYRTIAVCGIHIDRAVIVECRIECHSGTHTGAFYLSFCIDLCRNCMPTELRYGAVSHCIEPTLVDGVGDAIDIDSGC